MPIASLASNLDLDGKFLQYTIPDSMSIPRDDGVDHSDEFSSFGSI